MPSTPRSNQNRRMSSNSSRTLGWSQLKSGCSGRTGAGTSRRGCRPGSWCGSRSSPPNSPTQSVGGWSPFSPRPGRNQNRSRSRRAGPAGERRLEPGVRVGAVVGHDVDDDPDAQRVRLRDQRLGLGQGAEDRVDVAVVGHVVAGVGHRRGVPGAEPDRVDAERGQVVQAGPDAGEVADAVAVAVGEAARDTPGRSRLHATTDFCQLWTRAPAFCVSTSAGSPERDMCRANGRCSPRGRTRWSAIP